MPRTQDSEKHTDKLCTNHPLKSILFRLIFFLHTLTASSHSITHRKRKVLILSFPAATIGRSADERVYSAHLFSRYTIITLQLSLLHNSIKLIQAAKITPATETGITGDQKRWGTHPFECHLISYNELWSFYHEYFFFLTFYKPLPFLVTRTAALFRC